MSSFEEYAPKYQTVRMERRNGILQVTLHTEGQSLRWGFLPHGELPEAFHEHRLAKREANLAGLTECRLGADLLLIYRIRRNSVALHRIGTHRQLFGRRTKKATSKPHSRKG